MTDIWKDYAEYKADSDLAERYYAFIASCFEEGIKAVARTEPFDRALDIACGAGDTAAVLEQYARSVTGIDLSGEQIHQARNNPALKNIRFLLGDYCDYTPEHRFDLITAVWFHNFIHGAGQHKSIAEKIAGELADDGAIVFLFPSDSFASEKTREFAVRLTWRQAWYESEARCRRGVFSFRNSPWESMTCWQPLFLFEQYHPFFELHFLDTKKICVERGFLDDGYLNPTFEVMYGRKRRI
jgi:predicted TPR repeat methyltransferase